MNAAEYKAILDQDARRHGPRLLQSVRFGLSDEAHIAALLMAMRPTKGEHWIDIGCGFGTPARLMHRQRPDLRFTLINSNQAQLDLSPRIFPSLPADMHDIPLPAALFDGAMFLYSLCCAEDIGRALAEARRLVRVGGHLFVFDHFRVAGNNTLSWSQLHAQFLPEDALIQTADKAGWDALSLYSPVGDDGLYRQTITEADRAIWDEVFRDLVPFVWRAVAV